MNERESIDPRDWRPETETERWARHARTGSTTIETHPETLTAAGTHFESSVELVQASGVRPEAVRWLWENWIAAGKLHILAGPPGTGKTTVALSFVATLTSGRQWPDGRQAATGDVVIWSGEDGIADTLVPRLAAAGADLRRVRFVRNVTDAGGRRPFDPASDTPALALELATLGAPIALLVVDPISSAVAGDSHKNTETRRSLQPLVDLADRLDCAVLGISHFSKGTVGRDPVERVTGSIAFGALARLVLATVKTTTGDGLPGPRLLARVKSNLGPDGGGFHYSLDQVRVPNAPGVSASGVHWGDPVEGEARSLLAAAEVDVSSDAAAEQRDAVAFLRDLLESGPMHAKDVRKQADDAGYAWRTVQRAMRPAGVIAQRAGFGEGSSWALAPHSRHSRQAPKVGANGANDG